jgi:hypothetical protein
VHIGGDQSHNLLAIHWRQVAANHLGDRFSK